MFIYVYIYFIYFLVINYQITSTRYCKISLIYKLQNDLIIKDQQKQPAEVSFKKDALEICAKSTENTGASVFFLIRLQVSGLQFC